MCGHGSPPQLQGRWAALAAPAPLRLQTLPRYTWSCRKQLSSKKPGQLCPSFPSVPPSSSSLCLYPRMGAGPSFTSSQRIVKWKAKGIEQNEVTPHLKSVLLLLPCSSSLCLFLSISREGGCASYPTCEVWLKSIEIQLLSMRNTKLFFKNSS